MADFGDVFAQSMLSGLDPTKQAVASYMQGTVSTLKVQNFKSKSDMKKELRKEIKDIRAEIAVLEQQPSANATLLADLRSDVDELKRDIQLLNEL